ncbi:protein transport protein sec31-like [Patiria miniata]|uniref:Uncharacterized protein n=1 Tax=Patiria miniata TaxID=46514 RepID=A0A914ARU5_PATMI|nr:protein transport protein sec31-like [Patiria miniata]
MHQPVSADPTPTRAEPTPSAPPYGTGTAHGPSFGPTGNPAGYISAWSQPQTFFSPATPAWNPGPWGNPRFPTTANSAPMPPCYYNSWGFPTQWFPQMPPSAYPQSSGAVPTTAPTGSRAQSSSAGSVPSHTDAVITVVSDISDEESSEISNAGTSTSSLPASKGILRNPHKKDKGNPISDEVMKWWEELRTHKLSPEDHKEELSSFAVPEEQDKYFSAPELPAGIKKVFKQVNPSMLLKMTD